MKVKNFRFVGVVVAILVATLTFLTGLLSTMTMVQAASCSDDILRVKKDASGAADGCSWDDAFPDLQLALAAAESGNQIWVASGVYTPGIFVTDTFQLVDGVSIYGGFAATETLETERDWQENPTVLSGDIDCNDEIDQDGVVTTTANIVGRNSYHVVTGNGLSRSTILDGFYLTAGQSDEIGLDSTGGGMQNSNVDMVLKNIVFIGNMGCGLLNLESSPTLLNVLFENNLGDAGGGMINDSSSPILTDVVFINNASIYDGGGMYNTYSDPELFNVEFRQNHSGNSGGGMINFGFSSPVLEHVLFIENSADGSGGGLNNFYVGNPVLTDVQFIRNTAGFWGGGLMNTMISPTLVNVLFQGNVAPDGGGIANDGTIVSMTNIVLSGNYAEEDGGGVYNLGGSVEMNNVTFSGNVADQSGGGIFSDYESDVSIDNSIFWNNKDSSGIGTITATSTISENSVVTLTNSLVQGSGGSDNWLVVPHVDGGGNIDSDPLFLEPIDLTTVPTTTGNLRLQFGSPAIDAGDNDLVPEGITEDLEGKPRIIYGIVDMGAFEALWLENFLPLIVR